MEQGREFTEKELALLERMPFDVLYAFIMKLPADDVINLCHVSTTIRDTVCDEPDEAIWKGLWKRDISKDVDLAGYWRDEYVEALESNINRVLEHGYEVRFHDLVDEGQSIDPFYAARVAEGDNIDNIKRLLQEFPHEQKRVIMAAVAEGNEQLGRDLAEGRPDIVVDILLAAGYLLSENYDSFQGIVDPIKEAGDASDKAYDKAWDIMTGIYHNALGMAITSYKDPEVFERIWETGNQYLQSGFTLKYFIHEAAKHDRTDLVSYLINEGAEPSDAFRQDVPKEVLLYFLRNYRIRESLLDDMVRHNQDLELVKALVDAGARWDDIDESFRSAIVNLNLPLIEYLLTQGATVKPYHITAIEEDLGSDPQERDEKRKSIIVYLDSILNPYTEDEYYNQQ